MLENINDRVAPIIAKNVKPRERSDRDRDRSERNKKDSEKEKDKKPRDDDKPKESIAAEVKKEVPSALPVPEVKEEPKTEKVEIEEVKIEEATV